MRAVFLDFGTVSNGDLDPATLERALPGIVIHDQSAQADVPGRIAAMNEQIGLIIERGKPFGRYGARHFDPAGKAVLGYAGLKSCCLIRISREVAGDRQPPRQFSKPR